jgi:zinc protease
VRSPSRAQVLRIWALVVCALGAAGSEPRALAAEQAAPPSPPQELRPDTPLPVDPQVRHGVLANGVRYYVRANTRPERRAELRLVVNAGSILEEDDQRGLAHFLEHMAFNGTESFEKQELVHYLESVGMRFGPDLNAYTSFDETVYMLTIPTDSQHVVETGFQILGEWASGISLDSAAIEGERGVVVEEWRSRLGAQERVSEAQMPVLVRGSRYVDRRPIGLRETLETFPHEALRRFYRSWYRPDLMAVVAVGDFDAAQVEGMIRGRFGALPAGASAPPRPAHDVPAHGETLFLTTTDPELTTTRVEVLHKQPRAPSRTVADYRATLIEWLYDGMLNDRLTEITQKPGAPFLGALSSRGGLVRPTEVYALAAVVPEGGAAQGLEALLIESERVARHGFTATELERGKLNLLRSLERSYAERGRTNSGSYASAYVSHYLNGTPIPGIEFEYPVARSLLPTVALEEVNRLASEWNTEADRVVLVSAPEKPGVQAPGEAELRGVMAAVQGAQIEAYVDAVVTEPLVAAPPAPAEIVSETRHDAVDVLEWRLANGVRVLLKATDFRDDEIVMSAYSPGGLSVASDALYQSASFAEDVIQMSGAGAFSAVDLERALAGKAVTVQPYLGDLEEGISGFASPRDVETLFQLVYLYFTAPRFDEGAMGALRDQLRAVLANRGADPNAAFSDTLQATLAQHHPRHPPPTMALVDGFDARAAFDFFGDRFADASDFTFVFVGNLDVEAIRPLVQRWLGGLPSTRRADSWRDTGVRPPTGVVEKVVRQGVEPRAQTRLVFSGRAPYTRENRYTLRSLADVLDMRLREVLREDLGGTYGVSVSGSSVRRPEERYTFNIAFGAAPEQLDTLVAAVFAEIERLAREGPSADDLLRAREIQRRERETQLRQNGYWAGQLVGYAREGLDFAEITTYERLIDNLSVQQVRDAARAWLRRDNYVRVSLMPAGAG